MIKVGNAEYKNAMDFPDALPIMIKESLLILPKTYVPLLIEDSAYIKLAEDVLNNGKLIGILQTKTPRSNDLYTIGCIARLTSFSEVGDNKVSLSLEGVCRFRCIKELETNKPYRSFMITPLQKDFVATPSEIHNKYKGRILEYLEASGMLTTAEDKILEQAIINMTDISFDTLINSLCINADLSSAEQQLLLEAEDTETRANLLLSLSKGQYQKKHCTLQ